MESKFVEPVMVMPEIFATLACKVSILLDMLTAESVIEKLPGCKLGTELMKVLTLPKVLGRIV